MHKLGSTVTPDYNYLPIIDKVTMLNEQIVDKFKDHIVTPDSLDVIQSTAHNGAYYQAKYIFKAPLPDVSQCNCPSTGLAGCPEETDATAFTD